MLPAAIWVVVPFLFTIAPAAAVGLGGERLTFNLERGRHHGMELNQLRDMDRVRRGRFLQQSAGVVEFPVSGSYDPYTVGLYYTTVNLGNPPKEFYVQIDTGSDVLWVNCVPCSGCPRSSGLRLQLEFYDPSSSSTSGSISCNDQRCLSGAQTTDSICTQGRCSYVFQYGDGSGTSGYYVSDILNFNTVVGNSLTSNSSAPVVFGCSTAETGDLTKSDRAVDGIFGFGQAKLSVISQLSSRGITPRAFSHCLSGQSSGGGILVLGEIVEPNIVFTPLVPQQPHYNVALEGVSVNGQMLSIDSSVFVTSQNQGTIIDSGTTLAYLPQQIFDPLFSAILGNLPESVQTTSPNGNQCFITTSSLSDTFPSISFHFAGGATMQLNAQDYLLQSTVSGATIWCMGFQQSQGQAFIILGDLVLKDKIVVYDLERQRIGWANYDCSSPVNVSTSRNGTEYVNPERPTSGSSTGIQPPYLVTPFLAMALLLIHSAFFDASPFL